jgi:SAM-dependent methyltransferase
VFRGFYDYCINTDKKYFQGSGQRIEIGAGVSFFKNIYPEIVSTDIKKADNLDRVLDALDMDLNDNSVRAFYGLNCFHHFPEPRKFFSELQRTLVKGGGCVLIEPYYGPIAAKMYKNLFDTETFDKNQESWESESGYMLGANQALSYIVFVRDKKKFEKEYPGLEIVRIKVMNNYLRYLISGGLNFRSLLPTFMSPVIKLTEFVISPFNRLLGLHYAIVIRKK